MLGSQCCVNLSQIHQIRFSLSTHIFPVFRLSQFVRWPIQDIHCYEKIAMKEKSLERKAILTVEILPDERFAVKVNGALLAECRSPEDVDDFIDQWEQGAQTFRNGYEIRRTPVPATSKPMSVKSTAAGKLLQEDAFAAETYLIAAVRSLIDNHHWSQEHVRILCEYASQADFDAIQRRQQLPPLRTVPRKAKGLFGLFR